MLSIAHISQERSPVMTPCFHYILPIKPLDAQFHYEYHQSFHLTHSFSDNHDNIQVQSADLAVPLTHSLLRQSVFPA